jgi:hypothetical protein
MRLYPAAHVLRTTRTPGTLIPAERGRGRLADNQRGRHIYLHAFFSGIFDSFKKKPDRFSGNIRDPLPDIGRFEGEMFYLVKKNNR